jgi:hypothetical protein
MVASGTKLNASVGEDIKHRGALGHTHRMVVLVGQQHYAMTDSHTAGALADRAEEDFGRGAVRVLGQKMVLHAPYSVEAHLLSQLDLGDRLPISVVLAQRMPRLGHLQLVNQGNSH